MKYYVAYGSNMSVEQMSLRCPDAKLVGKTTLQDWKLKFKIHATIEPHKGSQVPALVWKVSKEDERSLDMYEGWPDYYIKKNVGITMTRLDGTEPRMVTAMVYVMAEGHQVDIPSTLYYGTMVKDYERFGFDKRILQEALNEAVNEAAIRNAAKARKRAKRGE
mgnify:CR=1 FL=1